MKKRLLTIMISAVLALTITACGSQPDHESASASGQSEVSAVPEDVQQEVHEVTEEIREIPAEEEPESEPASDTETSSVSEQTEPEPIEVETSGFYASSEDVIREIVGQLDGDVRVIFFDASETFEEYQIICSEGSKITRLMDVCCFVKDYYPEDYIQNMDMDSFYPGFSSMDFAGKTVSDAGDYYVVIARFDDLTNPENVQALSDNGIIIMFGDPALGIDVQNYVKLLTDAGKLELDPETMQPID